MEPSRLNAAILSGRVVVDKEGRWFVSWTNLSGLRFQRVERTWAKAMEVACDVARSSREDHPR